MHDTRIVSNMFPIRCGPIRQITPYRRADTARIVSDTRYACPAKLVLFGAKTLIEREIFVITNLETTFFEKRNKCKPTVLKRIVYYWKTTGTPSHYKNVPVKKLHPKNEKYVSRSY